jgi:hypothetical protein
VSSDPPPTLPTGVSMPLRCGHGGHPDLCAFCKADDELVANPELAETKQRPHDFGCPLFINESWTSGWERENYVRIYGGDGNCNCNCKKEK